MKIYAIKMLNLPATLGEGDVVPKLQLQQLQVYDNYGMSRGKGFLLTPLKSHLVPLTVKDTIGKSVQEHLPVHKSCDTRPLRCCVMSQRALINSAGRATIAPNV